MTSELALLLKTPFSQRNLQWEISLLEAVPTTQLYLPDPQPKPDPQLGWPYLWLQSEPQHTAAQAICLKDLINWATLQGVGIVLNGHKARPDYIFTYGMVWHYSHYNNFLKNPLEGTTTGSSNIEVDISQSKSSSAHEILPETPRKILREFLMSNEVLTPLMCRLEHPDKSWDLCLCFESLNSPREADNILQAISWFLPNHYSLILLHKNQVKNWQEL